MVKYKVFLGIEKINSDDKWCPTDLENEFEGIDTKFSTLKEAQELRDLLITMGTTTEEALQALATFILRDLRCECGCSYKDSHKEPCACGFTHISDIFEDELGIEFKEYPEAIKTFYKENYGIK